MYLYKIVVMVMLFVLFLLVIPLYLQFKYGIKSASGWLQIHHFLFTVLCILLEILVATILFFLILFLDTNKEIRCGFGLAGICVLFIPISFAIAIIGIIQRIVIKKD